MRTLCFGEALVDLICERPAASVAEAGAFVAHAGGVSANVAVAAARAGADVALAGGAGDDAWGAWLRDRLATERVGLEWFGLAAGTATGLAFVTLDERGDPTYQVRGDAFPGIAAALQPHLLDAVADTDALCFGSNALVGKAEAALAMAARERAIELERPIVFDANIRLGRWDGNPGRAGAAAGACVPSAFLVKCNVLEARLMTGESQPEAAAASLLAAGAQHVVLTLGTRGAIVRGKGLRRDVAARPAKVLSTVGAGDVFTGVMLAALGQTDFYAPAIAAALPDAAEAAARACERWGALE
ncbi:MAG TPA: PfkB family carbohydrate kinase [Solirubrobacteraceae bacterium]|nr:PfkB family carbohydrate kinase [Solirubrobacteraceae bacterium]